MSRISRGFPQQSRLGGYRVVGDFPPQVILPLPSLAMQTVVIHGVAVKVRVAYPRRTVKHSLFSPIAPKVGVDFPSGSASPTGSIVEAKIGADTQQNSASPSGALSEQTSTGIAQPFVEIMLAGHRRGRVALRAPLIVTSTRSTSDTVSGTAAPSGSRSEGLTHAPTVAGSAASSGSLLENFQSGQETAVIVTIMGSGRRSVQSMLRAPVVVLSAGNQGSDVVSGAASSSGSISWSEIHSSSVSGSASPAGFAADSFAGATVAPATRVVSVAVAQARTYRWKRRVEAFVYAPAVISPPIVPVERVIKVKLAILTRLYEPRRRGKVANPIARVIGPAVYADSPLGTAAPSTGSLVQALTHSSLPSGTAVAPTGSVVDQKVYSAIISGSAAASGSLVQFKIGSDTVSGSASATGSASDSFSSGNVFSDNPSGAASPVGTRVEARIATNSPSGSSTAHGSIVEQRLLPDAMTGAASPSGSLFSEQRFYLDSPSGTSTIPSGAVSAESFTGSAFVFGSASPFGTVVEKKVIGFGDTVVSVTVLSLRGPWSGKLRA